MTSPTPPFPLCVGGKGANGFTHYYIVDELTSKRVDELIAERVKRSRGKKRKEKKRRKGKEREAKQSKAKQSKVE